MTSSPLEVDGTAAINHNNNNNNNNNNNSTSTSTSPIIRTTTTSQQGRAAPKEQSQQSQQLQHQQHRIIKMDTEPPSTEPLTTNSSSTNDEVLYFVNSNNNDNDDDDDVVIPNFHHRRTRTRYRGRGHEWMQTIAGVAGNVLEWYDFAVFGFFGDVIGEVFFPPQAGNAALVESFAVFGGAFLMRPVGGIMMGYIGDTYGRKSALEISIFLMAFPTFAMGCLPSFEQVGWISPVLLIVVRLLQGLSVGGQLVSSLVFTLEGHPPQKWGLYGSYVMAAANFGTLLGGLMAFVLQSNLNPQQLELWGWRVPFLSGVLVVFSGLYLRYYGDNDEGDEDEEEHGHGHEQHYYGNEHEHEHDTAMIHDQAHDDDDYHVNHHHDDGPLSMSEPEQQQQSQTTTTTTPTPQTTITMARTRTRRTRTTNNTPLVLAFRKENLRSLLSATLVPMLWSSGFYLTFVWMALFMKDMVKPPVEGSFAINSTSLFFSVCLLFPLAGMLSDYWGRCRTMTLGGTLLMVLAPIMVIVIGQQHGSSSGSHSGSGSSSNSENGNGDDNGGSAVVALLAQSSMGVALSLWGAPMCAWLVESFPPQARLTSVAIGYNLAQATVGGMSPSIATIVTDNFGLRAPGFILSGVAILSLTGLWIAPLHHTNHTHTHDIQTIHNNNNNIGNSSNNNMRSRRRNNHNHVPNTTTTRGQFTSVAVVDDNDNDNDNHAAALASSSLPPPPPLASTDDENNNSTGRRGVVERCYTVQNVVNDDDDDEHEII